MRTIALDLSATAIEWAEAKDKEIVNGGRVPSLQELAAVLGEEPVRVAFEACRESWHVFATLEGWGHEPLMVDTTRVRQLGVGHHGRKNDRLDSEALALALDADRIPEAHVLSAHGHALRELQEMHRALTDTRKRLITHVRGLLKGRGIAVPSCSTDRFVSNMAEAEMPAGLRLLVEPLVQTLRALEPQLAAVDLKLSQVLLETEQRQQVVTRLATVSGVSLLVAAAFISVIDNPHRFERAGQVSSYLGLCPRENTTGYRQRLGAITKHGNGYARWMLVQASWAILRSRDTADPLVRWAHKTRRRRGAMKAAVAVARRLCRILWAMWRDGTCYDPAAFTHVLAPRTREQDARRDLTLKRAESKLHAQRRRFVRAAERAAQCV